MRVLFSALSLLVVVAVVGLMARHQLHALSASGVAERMDAAASVAGVTLPPPADAGRTVGQQAHTIEQQMRDAANQAVQQGAQRASDADQ